MASREYVSIVLNDENGNPQEILAGSGKSLSVLEESPSDIENGQDTVTTAGTAEALNGGASLTILSVTVKALLANSGTVYVGDSTVAAANGFELDPGQSVSFLIDDVSKVFVDSATNGDGVSWIAVV